MKVGSTDEKDRAKGVGLGFEKEASLADLQAMSQVAKFKKHYNPQKAAAQPETSKTNPDSSNHAVQSKADLHTKKRSVEAKELLLKEKREKKRDKKLRQKQ